MNELRFATALCCVLVGMLFPLSIADAAYDPLGSGSSKLTFDRSFLAGMRQNGVVVSAISPAKLRGSTVTLPVSGGKFDPTTSKGAVEHDGAIVFTAGNRRIPLRFLQLKTTQRRSPLSAKVGGSQLKLVRAGDLVVSREGFGNEIAVSKLSVSPTLATRLGKKLRRRDFFRPGVPLGRMTTHAEPETVSVLGRGTVDLTLDPGFAAKLQSLFVAVNPIFPAEHPGVQFTLPILGGDIAPDGSVGLIETGGSLELLQLGGGQIFWTEDWLDLAAGTASPEVNVQPSPPYSGNVGRISISDLRLSGAAIAADPEARTVTVMGAALGLQPSTAQTFNEVFAKPQGKDGVFSAGELLGTISFRAQGQ